mmetsp:Transcript_31241/g.66477  ORF Transcript_31241/g.66477 Transcript_31241/m.66477 type:complete len:209 (-) Transcript_31241:221-847(-)
MLLPRGLCHLLPAHHLSLGRVLRFSRMHQAPPSGVAPAALGGALGKAQQHLMVQTLAGGHVALAEAQPLLRDAPQQYDSRLRLRSSLGVGHPRERSRRLTPYEVLAEVEQEPLEQQEFRAGDARGHGWCGRVVSEVLAVDWYRSRFWGGRPGHVGGGAGGLPAGSGLLGPAPRRRRGGGEEAGPPEVLACARDKLGGGRLRRPSWQRG